PTTILSTPSLHDALPILIDLYPPFTPAFSNKALHTPNRYMGGQDLGALFAEIGRQVPPEYQSPFRPDFETFTGADAPTLLTGKIDRKSTRLNSSHLVISY